VIEIEGREIYQPRLSFRRTSGGTMPISVSPTSLGGDGLRELRGKVVLVNFWATWCPPCRQEIPALKRVYERFKAKGLIVLAISEEAPDTLRKFVAENDIRFPVLVDPGTKVGEQAFHMRGLPASFIYDRSGRLVAQALSMPTMERLL
jgi:peroxiredoxin